MPANGFTVTNEYIQDASGGQLTEFDGHGTWVHTNASAQGQLVATYDNDGQGVHFHLADWLGTRRMQTGNAGNPELQCQSEPFGDALVCSPIGSNAADATEIHFTGKERDSETGFANGNDYFGARYYSSSMARFMSPDWADKPEAVPYSDLPDPQSLNLYGYVRNNPLNKVDLTGHGFLTFLRRAFNRSEQAEGPDATSAGPDASYSGLAQGSTQQNANRQPDGSYKATPSQLADLRAKAAKKEHVYSPTDSDGQCVTACERFTGVPGPTTSWRGGKAATDLTDNDIGTAIATFGPNGHYPGPGEARNSATFMGRGVGGIWVADQWPKNDGNQPVRIWFMQTNDQRNPGNASMNASSYRVITVPNQ
jgi:RHS repeat-associated protein